MTEGLDLAELAQEGLAGGGLISNLVSEKKLSGMQRPRHISTNQSGSRVFRARFFWWYV